MAEETHQVPKSLVDREGVDGESLAWGMINRAQNVNADMIVSKQHTDTDYVFIIDRDKV